MKKKYLRFMAAILCLSLICGSFVVNADSLSDSVTEQTADEVSNEYPDESSYDPMTEYPDDEQEEKTIDMSKVSLETNSVTSYLMPTYYYRSKPYYNADSVYIPIISEYNFDYIDRDDFSYTSSNKKLELNVSIYDNKVAIYQYGNKTGKSTITINLYGKEFVINYTSKKVGISDQQYLLIKGKKKKLKVTGYAGKIVWKSSNPKIATVNSKGVVKGKKYGNVIITAKIGDKFLGCAVSVTNKKLKNVTKRATYMGTHWKYSQEKRNQKGYYDCSALVWKAYKEKARINFGSTSWPSTADYEAFWCRDHKRMVKGGLTYKKIKKMTVNPGDLLFKSTSMKKKYKDIYHVEMFTGYFCHSVNSDGTANYSPTWAARGTGYMWEEGSLLGRPMKY
ncbi:MAG: Ig-like domain-containing protein [Eubacterium sp.]|nr:Ig-like domain-containing protein [Eubacterium sp.]